jgi:putative DNA primase/helicase
LMGAKYERLYSTRDHTRLCSCSPDTGGNMKAAQIGAALRGRRNGKGWLVRCPCPNHGKGRGDRSPSLSVTDGDDDRLLLRCFAGCEFVDILDELKHRGLVNDNGIRRHTAEIRPFKPREPEPDPEALDIWAEAVEPHHTFVQEYLERRGITLLPQSICCQINRPAMVAAVQRPDGKIIAVQQTWLTRAGKKAGITPPRITTGALGTGAVRLGARTDIMGLAEGIETALSAMMLTGMTVWATLGAARLPSVWVPPEIRELHIFSDNDEAGRRAAKLAAEAHRLVRTVVPRFPPDQCKDYNDYLNLIADRDGRDLLPEGAA